MWTRSSSGAFDKQGCELADRHYSRRKIGSPQFMPPGQRFVLIAPGAVWGWWRPHPKSGIKAMNGLDGWTCVIFRNESQVRSSLLVLEAENELVRYCNETGANCGPSGMLTYVWDAKIKSSNPGYCYKKAGWRAIGRSADKRKTLLHKPFRLAGVDPEQRPSQFPRAA